jgi:DNA-binding XRE family transcriptional regulator
MTETGSSVPRRQMGRLLKQARERAGMALQPAAAELEFSRARMYRIEGGEVSLRKHDVLAMCQLYDVNAQTAEVLLGLAR